jgi:hypothetical protein
MGFIVRPLNGVFVRGFDQTEWRRAHFIEPVSNEANAVFPLCFQIFRMRSRENMAGDTFHVMAVHVDGHRITAVLREGEAAACPRAKSVPHQPCVN